MAKKILFLMLLGSSVILAAKESIIRDLTSAEKYRWGKDLGNTDDHRFNGYRADFDLDIEKPGWHTLYLHGKKARLSHYRILVNGELARHGVTISAASGKDRYRGGNIWLEKGRQTVSIYLPTRVWNSMEKDSPRLAYPEKVEFAPYDGNPENSFFAEKTFVDVMRVGEDFVIRMTGGGTGKEMIYELSRQECLANGKTPAEVVKTVVFAPSERAETKEIAIPCDKEGAFILSGCVKGAKKNLSPTDFQIGRYFVVDVNAPVDCDSKPEKIIEVDCVKQTINGKPLSEGMYFETNGPSRVVTTKAGTYRESHDGSEPLSPGGDGSSEGTFSALAYHFELPEEQVPYLIDITFPDDTRRNTAVYPCWLEKKNGNFCQAPYTNGGYGKAYVTGGPNAFTNKMRHHKALVWAATKHLALCMIQQELGTRAATATITISKFGENRLPIKKGMYNQGRKIMQWSEESNNWRLFVNPPAAVKDEAVNTMISMERLAQLVRFYGANAIGALGIGYFGVDWRTRVFEPLRVNTTTDQPRLMALICEKYGIYYSPDIFRATERMSRCVIPAKADQPEDVYCFNSSGSFNSTQVRMLEPLHPSVQQTWIDGLGEIADKLRDSPAFAGFTVRSMGWFFSSDFFYPSLSWGYGDWVVRKFEKETGIKVPVAYDDPERYAKRFSYLTSDKMKKRWLAWRNAGIADYLKRLGDRINEKRDDVTLMIRGDLQPTKEITKEKVPENELERSADCGLDFSILGKENSVGRLISGEMADLAGHANDGFRGATASAAEGLRELQNRWAADRLGIGAPKGWRKGGWGTSVFIPSGYYSLKALAQGLATQDTVFFIYGSNSDQTGDVSLWRPWLAQYTALPNIRFTDVKDAVDPVRVRYGKRDGKYYVYAVNSADYPVEATIHLERNAHEIAWLPDGRKEKIDGKVHVKLAPFALLSFTAPSKVVSVQMNVPEKEIAGLQKKLAYAEEIIAPEADGVFRDTLNEAWKAYQNKNYSRSEDLLVSQKAKEAYEKQMKTPTWANHVRFPNLLTGEERHISPKWRPLFVVKKAKELRAEDSCGLMDSGKFNPEWTGTEVLGAKGTTLTLSFTAPADGRYNLAAGVITEGKGAVTFSLDGKGLPGVLQPRAAGAPDTFVANDLLLKAGKHHLTIRHDGKFGVYAYGLYPQLRPISARDWIVIGPFRKITPTKEQVEKNPDLKGHKGQIELGFAKKFIPDGKPDLKASYDDGDGGTVAWKWLYRNVDPKYCNQIVNLAEMRRDGYRQGDFNYGVTYVTSDRDRTATISISGDWEVEAWLNGELVKSDEPFKNSTNFGSWCFPPRGVVHLKKGVNILKIKERNGSLGAGFAGHITDDPGIKTSHCP